MTDALTPENKFGLDPLSWDDYLETSIAATGDADPEFDAAAATREIEPDSVPAESAGDGTAPPPLFAGEAFSSDPGDSFADSFDTIPAGFIQTASAAPDLTGDAVDGGMVTIGCCCAACTGGTDLQSGGTVPDPQFLPVAGSAGADEWFAMFGADGTSVPYYVQALMNPNDQIWNASFGEPVTISFGFYDSAPSYLGLLYNETTFLPFGADERALVRSAIDYIEELTNITIVESASQTADMMFGRVDLAGNVGVGFYPGPSFGGDVWIDDNAAYDSPVAGTRNYMAYVHEIGHGLGLKHPGASAPGAPLPYLPVAEDTEQYTVMSYAAHAGLGVYPTAPMLYDVAALQYYYGVDTGTRAGDDTYQFSNGTPDLATIWDGGGNDTIDASNQSAAVEIDLAAGAFSRIGTTAQNIAIAFGAEIENAIGGTAADTLFGNDLGNVLTGGQGDDVLWGFNGTDTLAGGAGSDTLRGGTDADIYQFGTGWGTDTVIDGDLSGTLAFSGFNAADLTASRSADDLVLSTVGGDSVTVGGYFDDPLRAWTFTADDGAFDATAPLTAPAPVRFAVIGDYGVNGPGALVVANLIKAYNVDFIVTVGDNAYAGTTLDDAVGQYYSDYIGNYVGVYGSGSAENRFFPALGNHDITDGGGLQAYLDYFTLPGNERYYDVEMGPVHFFILNSDGSEPDGVDSGSIQAQWLQAELAASNSAYNVVVIPNPPFSSGAFHGSVPLYQWDFEAWGADAVLSGDDHDYERIMRDDNGDLVSIPYFVTGLGGNVPRGFDETNPVDGSAARYWDDNGALIVDATATGMKFTFLSVERGGTFIDGYTIDAPALPQTVAEGEIIISAFNAAPDGIGEYIELFNTSDREISLEDLQLILRVDADGDGDIDIPWQLSADLAGKSIAAHSFFLIGEAGVVAAGGGAPDVVADIDLHAAVTGSDSRAASLQLKVDNIHLDFIEYGRPEGPIPAGDWPTTGGIVPGVVEMIGRGSNWAYLDDGSDPGTAWRSLPYDIAGWSIGAGQLGYGDGDEATVVDFGGDPGDRHITTYFRHYFTVTDASSVTALALNLLRDDGAIVYLNGTEVVRSNMAAGAVDSTTLAGYAGDGDEWAYTRFTIDPALLVSGTNLIAVEVHQNTPSSSDLSFDLELIASTTAAKIGVSRDTNPDPGFSEGAVYRASAADLYAGHLVGGQYTDEDSLPGSYLNGVWTSAHDGTSGGFEPRSSAAAPVPLPAVATEGDDVLTGTAGADLIDGLGGNDTIDGLGGNDYLEGGDGDDVVHGGDGDDTIFAGTGLGTNDVLYGDDGDDEIWGSYSDDGFVTVYGGVGNDQLSPLNGGGLLFGEDGNDTLYGGLYVGSTLDGGAGDDIISGINVAVDNIMIGGTGNDTLIAGLGNDSMRGGADQDTYVFDTTYGWGQATVLDNTTNDIVHFYGIDSTDVTARRVGFHMTLDVAGQSTITLQDYFEDNSKDWSFLADDGAFDAEAMAYVINGTSGDDMLGGDAFGARADEIHGGAGNDTLNGFDLDDVIYGDDGDDIINGGDGNDILHGGDGIDHLNGQSGNDQLYGGVGSDYYQFQSGWGQDVVIDASSGNTINISDLDWWEVAQQRQIDDLILSHGTDEIRIVDYYATDDARFFIRANNVAYEVQAWVATEGDDDLQGSSHDEIIDGLGGNDIIHGGYGNDTLLGGDGNDILYGDLGDDELVGGAGDDQLIANGGGENVLDGGSGNDVLTGYNGVDTYRFGIGWGNDIVTPANSREIFQFVEINSADLTTVKVGGDLLITHASGDTISVQSYFLSAGRHWDFVTADGFLGLNVVGTAAAEKFGGSTYDDTIVAAGGDDEVNANDGNDTVILGDGNDVVHAGSGNDTLYGDDGDDVLWGEDGNDIIFGGAGQDQIWALNGNDVVDGGDGDDEIYAGDGNDEVHGGGGNDYVQANSGTNILFGDDGNDELRAGLEGDELHGGAGDDNLRGNIGNDLLFGGAGIDAVRGGDGDDTLDGGDDGDFLYGEAGNDTVDGGAGNDTIYGGAGDDNILGGLGDDWIDTGTDDDAGPNGDMADGGDGDDYIYAGPNGIATLYGGAGADHLYGSQSGDQTTIYGGDGDDYIDARLSTGAAFGEGGNDTLIAGEDGSVLDGGDGDDILQGSIVERAITMVGGAGNDTLIAGRGDDIMQGGNGIDRYVFDYPTISTDYSPPFSHGVTLTLIRSGSSFGDLTVIDTDVDNVMEFQGIAADAIVAQRVGADLTFRAGQMPTVTVVDYFIDDTKQWTFLADDGAFDAEARAYDIYGTWFDDILRGDEFGARADTVYGDLGNDVLYGYDLDDILYGGNGNDALVGGAGADTMYGGFGNDTYYVEDATDVVIEEAGLSDGEDTVRSYVGAFTLSAGVENLILLADAAADGTGNGSNNTLDGNGFANTLAGFGGNDQINGHGGDDMLLGGDGDDTLRGGDGDDLLGGEGGNNVLLGQAGNDTLWGDADGSSDLRGGIGDDTYYVFGANDIVVEQAGEGVDIVHAFASYSVSDNIEALILEDIGEMDGTGSNSNDGIQGNSFANVLTGLGGDDLLVGYDGDDQLLGGDGNDELFGLDGDDTIDGSDGDDTLFGGDGNDVLQGGLGLNQLEGGAGDDLLMGLPGVYSSNQYKFSPGWGNDTIRDDGYGDSIDFNAISEAALTVAADAADVTISDGAGNSVTIENFIGYMSTYWWVTTSDGQFDVMARLNATYTDDAGGTTRGEDFGDIIFGGAGVDVIYGYGGDDALFGGAGVDYLLGGNGRDYMHGGAGDDYFYVTDIDDRIGEEADEGYDTVRSWVADFALPDNVEALIVLSDADGNATGNALDNTFDGNDFVNVFAGGDGSDDLNGYGGDDVMSGDGGDDRLRGGEGNDMLTGGTGNDALYGHGGDDMLDGGDGNDWLIGGTGLNTLIGGGGSDFFIVDMATDVIVENLNEGADTVHTTLDNFVLGANIEHLTLLEGVGITGTGNELDNTINANSNDNTLYGGGGDDDVQGWGGDDVLYGDAGLDHLRGGDGNDTLWGGDGNDILYGHADNDTIYGEDGNDALIGDDGDDILVGGAGNDWHYGGLGQNTMTGGTGNDFYVVENFTDTIVELDGEGEDSIHSWVDNYVLGAAIENLLLKGAVLNGTGNELDNTLDGNDQANLLSGGDGSDDVNGYDGDDTLYGDGGNDRVRGGAGNDTVHGGDGDDILYGHAGNDTIHGDAGADLLLGAVGDDILMGGTGADRYWFFAGDGSDTIEDATLDDTVSFYGANAADIAGSRSGDDLVLARTGGDQVTVTDYFAVAGRDWSFIADDGSFDPVPGAPAPTVLYDAATDGAPGFGNGWFFGQSGGTSVRTTDPTFHTLDTIVTPGASQEGIQAAYQLFSPSITLDSDYMIDARLRIDAETHSDDDRAGFSLIAIGQDPTQALEIGFWEDRVWVFDYTATPEPGAEDFSHGAEFLIDTTQVHDYRLWVKDGGFTILVDDEAVLSGAMEDYTGSRPFPAPYDTPNAFVFGDDTSRAASTVEIYSIAYHDDVWV